MNNESNIDFIKLETKLAELEQQSAMIFIKKS